MRPGPERSSDIALTKHKPASQELRHDRSNPRIDPLDSLKTHNEEVLSGVLGLPKSEIESDRHCGFTAGAAKGACDDGLGC